MSYLRIEQNTPEWWAYKVGKVSGTRFGKVISSRENMLIEELADEKMNGCCEISDYEDEDIIFGKENESIAIDLYEEKTGLKFERGGVLQNDNIPIHIASPDGLNMDKHDYWIALEVKSTRHGYKHLSRFKNGIESDKKPQLYNYFAVDKRIKEVRFISYCPFRPERPIVEHILYLNSEVERKETKSRGLEITTVQDKVDRGLFLLTTIEKEVNELINNFKQLEF